MEEMNSGTSIHDLAALYAIDALGPDESLLFEEHLQSGCARCEEDVAAHRETAGDLALAGSLADATATPPASLRQRVLASIRAERMADPDDHDLDPPEQIWRNWAPSAGPRSVILRSDEGGWQATGIRGVTVRRLFYDPTHDQVTMLIRMDRGTSWPAHRHAGPEECYVLEGDLSVGGTVMRKGDYQRVEADSLHPVQTTENGCLLYITSSVHDELLV